MEEDLDLYAILGVDVDATQEQIAKEYRKLAKKYHPNRNKTDTSELFQLITNAYEILSNQTSRAKYNAVKSGQQLSFTNLKERAQAYAKEQPRSLTIDSKQKYKEQWEELNKKNNFNESMLKDVALPKVDATKKYNDLLRGRDVDYQEYKPEKIFESENVSMTKFNEAFDIINKGKICTSEINVYEQPDAWDKGGIISYSDLTVDELYEPSDNVYEPNSYNFKNATKVDASDKKRYVTEQKNGADYYINHNAKGQDYQQQIKDKLKERENMTKELSKVVGGNNKQNFSTYGIFDKIGMQFDTLSINAPDEKKVKSKYDGISRKQN